MYNEQCAVCTVWAKTDLKICILTYHTTYNCCSVERMTCFCLDFECSKNIYIILNNRSKVHEDHHPLPPPSSSYFIRGSLGSMWGLFSQCFWLEQYMINNRQLKKKAYLIRFGHRKALLQKEVTQNSQNSRPAKADPYVFRNGFCARKKVFLSNCKNHHSSLLPAVALSQNGRIAL